MFQNRIVERRAKPRIEGSFPASVRGTAICGESFELQTQLDNLSVSGLHVCLQQPVAVASTFFAIIRLARLEVKARGVVRRVELRPDGSFALGVSIDSYRVFSVLTDTGRRGAMGRQSEFDEGDSPKISGSTRSGEPPP